MGADRAEISISLPNRIINELGEEDLFLEWLETHFNYISAGVKPAQI